MGVVNNMTVSELIKWLETQDQSATVQVIVHEMGYGYYNQGGNAQTVVFDPSQHSEHYENSYLNCTELLLGVFEG